MDSLIKSEMRYREHAEHVAHVNAESWKRQAAQINGAGIQARRHPLRTAVAKALLVLANRLSPSLPSAAERNVAPTKQFASGAN